MSNQVKTDAELDLEVCRYIVANAQEEPNYFDLDTNGLRDRLNGLIVQPHEIDYVIYHGNCSDGFTGAYCAWKVLGDRATYYGAVHDVPPPSDLNGKNIVFIDFSYKQETMDHIFSIANKFVVLDHHITAVNYLKNIPDTNKVLEMKHSGAYLAWRYFNPTSDVPLLVQYVQDRDIWTNAMPDTVAFSTAYQNMDFDFNIVDRLMDNNNIPDVITNGKSLLEFANKQIREIKKNSTICLIKLTDGKQYVVNTVNSVLYKSELGNLLVNEHELVDFGMVYHYDSNTNKTCVSLRSTNAKQDVSYIASLFNGGGHKASSGCALSGQTYMLPNTSIEVFKKTPEDMERLRVLKESF